MVYSIVYKQRLYRYYRASTCSIANLTRIYATTAKIIFPLIILFFIPGFWHKFDQFREIPRVSFDGKFLIVFQSKSDYRFASSFAFLNTMDVEHLRLGTIQSTQIDSDRNGKADTISISSIIPLDSNFTVSSFVYFIFLDYKLEYYMDLDVQTAITDTVYPPFNSSEYSVSGVLESQQIRPFIGDFRKEDIVEMASTDPNHYTLPSINTRLKNQIINTEMIRSTARYSPTVSPSFTFNLEIDIVEDTFTYQAEFFQLLKWAWIQYLAVFLIFHYLIDNLLEYFYENGVVEAIPSGTECM